MSDHKLKEAIRLKNKNETDALRKLSPEEEKIQTKKWTTFFRRNIEIYIEHYLGINLHPFQRIMLHLMGTSQTFFAICSRALGKTFIVGLFCMAKCLLFPYSEVVITASTSDQGAIMVREKIQAELIGKLSHVLKYYYDNGLIEVTTAKDNVGVTFFNGSTIRVLPPIDSSRGPKATIIVYDECRTLKKSDIDSIFEGMTRPRQALYMNKSPYSTDERLQEKAISIYITSARTKAEWFWRHFKKVVENCYKNEVVNYNFFAGDIFLAIKYGLKNMADLAKAKEEWDELDLRMEYYNEMLGEAEGALFTFEDFKRNQKLQKPFYPPTLEQFNLEEIPFFRKKALNETRILVVDFAFAGTTKSGQENDNTAFICMSGFYNQGEMIRQVDYLETHAGGYTYTEHRLRELFWDYDADYLVFDLKSGGDVYYNELTDVLDHSARASDRWKSCGFTVSHDEKIQQAPAARLEELRGRTRDRNAIPVLIPIIGSPETNSIIWQQLKSTMNKNKIKFLIDDIEVQTKLNTQKSFRDKSREERTRILLPYVQTNLLIAEGIEIQAEWSSDKLKVQEPRSGTKDRIISLAYGNYFFHLLENKKAKLSQDEEFNEDDWNLVYV